MYWMYFPVKSNVSHRCERKQHNVLILREKGMDWGHEQFANQQPLHVLVYKTTKPVPVVLCQPQMCWNRQTGGRREVFVLVFETALNK